MYTVSTTPPLTRERAIAAAIATADAEGLDAVSMRRLATRLGVTAMALYKHVANKEDLLAGMVDAVVVGYESPVDPRDWRDAVAQRVRAARRALVRHPWMRRAIESRTARTAAVLGHMDAVAGEMLAGGLTPDLVHHAMHALGHRLWGFSPEAFDDDARPPTELHRVGAGAPDRRGGGSGRSVPGNRSDHHRLAAAGAHGLVRRGRRVRVRPHPPARRRRTTSGRRLVLHLTVGGIPSCRGSYARR